MMAAKLTQNFERPPVERWEAVKDALDLHRAGLDFEDALHWTCSRECSRFITFDDRGFIRRAKRLKLNPEVTAPVN